MGYGSETASTEYTNVFKASTADFSDFCVKTTSNAISTTYVKYLTGRSGAPGAASCYYKTDANDDRRWLTVNQKSRDYLRRSESCGPAKSDYRYMQSKRPDLTVINEEGGDTCDVSNKPAHHMKNPSERLCKRLIHLFVSFFGCNRWLHFRQLFSNRRLIQLTPMFRITMVTTLRCHTFVGM